MILYLDTSAVIPLVVAEPASAACRRLLDDADGLVSCRLVQVEAAAALAAARRADRITAAEQQRCLRVLGDLWPSLDLVEVDEPLIRRACELADLLSLRGYDAVHCAAAELVADDTLVAASGDRLLLRAWSSLGLQTSPTHPAE